MSILRTVFAASLVSGISCAVLTFPPRDKSITATLHGGSALPDSRYEAWSDPSKILYFLDGSYNATERIRIEGAMDTIGADMASCIQFVEYSPMSDAGKSYIYISKTLNDGTTPPTCVTFFGRVVRAAGQGQKMILHNEPNGCMGSVREIMKVLVNVLGLRNEYRRPDRDRYMLVRPENMIAGLQGTTLLTQYNDSDVYYPSPFDYHSLTMLPDTKYAMPNKPIYSYPTSMVIPDLDNLSLNDCLGLAWMYGCDVQKCRDPYTTDTSATTAALAGTTTVVPHTDTTTTLVGVITTAVTPVPLGSDFNLLLPAGSTATVSPITAAPPGTDVTPAAPKGSGSLSVISPAAANKVAVTSVAEPAAPSALNISFSTKNTAAGGPVDTVVLDRNATGGSGNLLTSVQQKPGSTSVQVQNPTNATQYITLYGPPGFTGGFVTSLGTTLTSTGATDVTVSGNATVATPTPVVVAVPATTTSKAILVP